MEKRWSPGQLPPHTTWLVKQRPERSQRAYSCVNTCQGSCSPALGQCNQQTAIALLNNPDEFGNSSCSLTDVCDGVAYDYEALPKIVSIHSTNTKNARQSEQDLHTESLTTLWTSDDVDRGDADAAICTTPPRPRTQASARSLRNKAKATNVSDKISVERERRRTEKESVSCRSLFLQLQTDTPVPPATYNLTLHKGIVAGGETKRWEFTSEGDGGRRHSREHMECSRRVQTMDESSTDVSTEARLVVASGKMKAAISASCQTSLNEITGIATTQRDGSYGSRETSFPPNAKGSPRKSGRWLPLAKKHIVKKLIAKIRDLQDKRNKELYEEKRQRLGVVILALHEKLKTLVQGMKNQTYSENKDRATNDEELTVKKTKICGDLELRAKCVNDNKLLRRPSTRPFVLQGVAEHKAQQPKAKCRVESDKQHNIDESIELQREITEITKKRTWEDLNMKPPKTVVANSCKKLKGTLIECVQPSTKTKMQELITASPHESTQKGSSEDHLMGRKTATEQDNHRATLEGKSKLDSFKTFVSQAKMNPVAEDAEKSDAGPERPAGNLAGFSAQCTKRKRPCERPQLLRSTECKDYDNELSASGNQYGPKSEKRQRVELVRSVDELRPRDTERLATRRCVEKLEAGVEESREDLPVSSFAVLSRKTPEDAPTKKDDASDLSWNEICFKDHSQPDYNLTERKIISWNHSGQFAESQGRGSAGFSFQDDAARQNSFQLRETRISNLLGKQNELLEDLKRMKGNSYRGA